MKKKKEYVKTILSEDRRSSPRFPSNSLFKITLDASSEMSKSEFERKKSERKERGKEEKTHTRRRREQQALQAETHFSNVTDYRHDKIVCRFVATASYSAEKKLLVALVLLDYLFDEPILPFRCSVGLPMRACRLIR